MDLSSRVTTLNDANINTKGSYVLYWMQMFKRASHNYALNFAIQMANEHGLPLVVYEGLKFYYPWANDRLHTFILEGVEEKQAEFAERGIRYVFYLQRNDRDPKHVVAQLARDAALLVTDDFPCFIIPDHNERIARLDLPVYAVDANGMVPLSALTKEEYAAYTIRPKIHRLLPDVPRKIVTPHLKVQKPSLDIDSPETKVTATNIVELVAQCDIDHSVKPSNLYHGGTKAGRKRLKHFVSKILPHYVETHNEPSVDGVSRLSPYLHFGFLSIQEIVAAVERAKAPKAGRDAFLEQVIVRRELSFNLTRHNLRYDSLQSLPPWALQTMREHKDDPHPELIDDEKIEAAETYDELWNAAQRELVDTGLLHNYVRMLWGKKVIEWQRTYEMAFELLVHLNNKYALDGRDPNSYAGILWCFGKHDRPWFKREIFGAIRYMTSRSMAKKFNSRRYIESFQ
ncbi:MAG TPA: deoxyribodipyrimidine photo-lyase [Pyrinomonadaceae bacterium]|nr:deoxyribodipyrimidine photo-lyase [Pyrinomonadaceae bacterium]